MRELLSVFAKKLLAVASSHPNLRFNLTLPGYMLQQMDPLQLTRINELQKSGNLEWLSPGYTEPLVCFSPLWLSRDNLSYGLDVFNELVGTKPGGYVPTFSNWEPSSIAMLLECGINYTILSRFLFPEHIQPCSGYWITEHTGSTMVIIPSYPLHPSAAPEDILGWLDHSMQQAKAVNMLNIMTIDYQIPIDPGKDLDPFTWLNSFATTLDTILINYQMNLLQEFPTIVPPLGLQYLPTSLEFKQPDGTNISSCENYLHTFDSVGIIQRKMMDVAERLNSYSNQKDLIALKKQLFFVQDINRYLPNESSGFPHLADRFFSFGQMIEIEQVLHTRDNIIGGHIRIADFLKNGTKTIVMSNKNITVYIDYKNGGQIFELDYREKSANLCAGHNPASYPLPRILFAGKSRTCFIDHFLSADCNRTDFTERSALQLGDFVTSPYDYKIKKTATSVKTILSRQGSITINEKQYPIVLEKVFGLEKDKAELSFVYQLSNHSLITYAFKFAIELTFALPGAHTHQAEIISDTVSHNRLAWDRITLENTTQWTLNDKRIGVSIRFITQKPVTVWFYPSEIHSSPYQGTTMVISSPVSLEENAVWSLMGKCSFKKVPHKGDSSDVI